MSRELHKDPVTVTLSKGDYDHLVKLASGSKDIVRQKFKALVRILTTTEYSRQFREVAQFIDTRIEQMVDDL